MQTLSQSNFKTFSHPQRNPTPSSTHSSCFPPSPRSRQTPSCSLSLQAAVSRHVTQTQPCRVVSATASRLDSSPTSQRAGASPLFLLSGSASCAWATLSLPAPPLLAVSVVSALEHSAQTSASAGCAPGSGSAGSRGGPTLTSEQALNRPKGDAAPQVALAVNESAPASSHPRRRCGHLPCSFLSLFKSRLLRCTQGDVPPWSGRDSL